MVVDANIWVAYFVIGDAFHLQARKWLLPLLLAKTLLVAPTILLPEVAGPVTRRVNGAAGLDALNYLQNVETLTLFDVDETTLGAGAARIASNLSLHGADAVYVALAHELNIPLYTWDKDVQNKTKGFITVNIP